MALFGGLKDIPVDGELNFCGTIRRILEVFEYWGYSYPARCEGNPRRKRLYIIWGVILNLLTIYLVTAFQLVSVYQLRSDLNVAIEAASILPAAFQILSYQLIVRVFREEIKRVLHDFYDRVANFDLENPKIRDLLIVTEDRNRKLYLYLNVFCIVTVNVVVIIGDKSISAGLPIITWLPFDLSISAWRFYAVYGLQMLELYYMAFFNMTFENFFQMFSLQLHCELRLIQETIKEITVQQGDLEIRARMRHVMQMYCALIDGFARLEVFLGWVACGQFGGGICAISLVLYQFHLSSGGDVMVILGVVVLVFAISIKMFFMSFVATHIAAESENIAHNLCALDWWDFTVENRKHLLLMIRSAQRPITLKAFGLFPVNLNSFIAIIKLAYSVFSLMIEMDAA